MRYLRAVSHRLTAAPLCGTFRTRSPVLLLLAASLLAGSAVTAETTAGSGAGTAAESEVETEVKAGRVDAARIEAADSEPGSWLAHGRTYDEQRFSPLSQISGANVGQLGLAWSYRTNTKRGLEATPIVVDGVLYATGTWSVVYALDAATGREIWTFDPQVPREKGRDACCDVVNRGVAVWKGRVYVGTIDGRLIALDAATGTPVWDVLTIDPAKPYTITGAPRVVKDRVIIGNGGAEFGVRGYFSAYDAETGEMSWRFYTVPASKQGPHEHPELAAAAATWSANSLWELGLGGTVWDSMAYDPKLDLLYVGVGNSSVYDRERRSPGGGDNLFLASILAVRPETGRLVWHYQTTPGEHWDYTATQHIVLADLELGGRLRKLLLQAPKNGFFYVLDRETGELLSAEKYSVATWATHVDLATGRPVERPEAVWSSKDAVVSPGVAGAHNWHPMSFSPRTGLVYIPSTALAYSFYRDENFEGLPHSFNTGEDWGAISLAMEGYEDAARFCSPSHITAWDPVRQQATWRVEHESQVPGGLLSTAGDLVFQGSGGEFAAYDARDGRKLWSTQTRVGVMAAPVTYEAGGEQYVAVLAGVGGSHGIHRDILEYENDGRILAWKLGGEASMPPVARREPGPRSTKPPKLALTPQKVDRGRNLYARHCARCHGMTTRSTGVIPDLKHSKPEVHEGWDDIVRGGVLAGGGMASFRDVVDEKDSEDIHAYVVARALHEPGVLEELALWASQYVCIPAEWVTD
jgi:quinohemoprotein ethanol dehydrogenase